MLWKDFFYFTRSERQGIIVLIVLIILLFTCCWLIPPRDDTAIDDTEQFKKEYEEFIASIREKEQKQQTKYARHFQKRTVVLTSFDPNTADSIEFISLGLPSWMAKNILKYRSKGGVFHQAEEFKKVYGLTAEQYNTLLPYIHIDPSTFQKDTLQLFIAKEKRDTIKPFKYPAGTRIDLNLADTTELKKIPGIGSGIAHMIIRRRKELGGFYDIEQLREINLRADKLRNWFTIKEDSLKQININRASIERLKSHPYINFYQAKVIVEYRKRRGKINSLQELSLYKEFTPEDMERIRHYVCF